MAMSPKQLKKWAKTRQMGRTRYIWLYGVLGWGLMTGLSWSVAMGAMQGWKGFPMMLAFSLVGFPIGGYFFGAITWRKTENQFKKVRKAKKLDAE